MCEWVGMCVSGWVCVRVGRYVCAWVGMCLSGWVYMRVGRYAFEWLGRLHMCTGPNYIIKKY